jgi:hypothetical protein
MTPVPAAAGRRRHRDEGVAMLAVVVTMLLLVPIAVAGLAIVINRQKDVVYERSRTATAHVAEAGLDGATAALRAAESGGQGVRADLPCADGTPMTGTVGAQAQGLRYAVQVRYYLTNPQGHDEAWRQANKLTCTPGSGLARTPYFALLQSAATGSQTLASFAALRERSLESVYRFNVDNENIGGGLVRTRAQNNGSAVDLCWAAAGGAAPSPGTAAVMATCDDGSAAQMMSYRPDHTYYNVAAHLCLANTGSDGSPLTFQTCSTSPSQTWIYTNTDNIQAVAADGTSLTSLCIGMQTAYQLGTPLVLAGSCVQDDPRTSWSPEARVGPGGAGESQYQLVNFAQFARCFDVTDWNYWSSFMQLHPCKQSTTQMNWPPQQLVYEASTGLYRIGNPSNQSGFCLTSPDPAGTSEYVVARPCDATSPRQRWTRTGDSGAWSSSYTIVDADGRCLAQGPVPPDPNRTFNAIIVATCDGTVEEKWNAPPELVNAGVEGFRETTGN